METNVMIPNILLCIQYIRVLLRTIKKCIAKNQHLLEVEKIEKGSLGQCYLRSSIVYEFVYLSKVSSRYVNLNQFQQVPFRALLYVILCIEARAV